MPSHEIAKDDICLTNLSKPGGLVKVLEVVYDEFRKEWMCFIKHVEDHPYGYKKGDKGWYALNDLIFVRTMTIHDRMRERSLKRADYHQYLSRYRKMGKDGYLAAGFEEWPFEGVFEDGMSRHAFGIWQHLKSVKRDPEWMHYLPVSDAYSEYHTDRITDYGGDMYEVRIESAAEVWKFEHGW